MTYLSIAKDEEKTKRRHDLMKQLARLQDKFTSLWIDKEEIIAPFNEKQIKDTSRDTLDDFLIEFNGVVNGFMGEGMYPEHIEHYHKVFSSRDDLKHYLDIGLIKNLNNFFLKLNTKLRTERRIIDRIASELEKCVNSTSTEFNLNDMELKRQDINMLKKGLTALRPTSPSWLGVLPTVTEEELSTLKGDDLRNILKPLSIEYRYLEEYLAYLLLSAKEERIRLEEDYLTNQYKLDTLDIRMEHYQSQIPHVCEQRFSELQRTLLAKFYMDNKKNNTIRQGLEGESVTKDLLLRYEALIYLLHGEYGIKNNANGLNSILYKVKETKQYLTELEKLVYNHYRQAEAEITEQTIKYEEIRFGVLEHKHIKILTLVLELHRTVADIIYRNPTLSGLYINLQFTVTNFFVQFNPSNLNIAENLKVFPFRLGDDVIEGFLISKGFDEPYPEPTVTDLINIIAKRNNLATDMYKSYSGVLTSLNKAIEREEVEDTSDKKQKPLKEVLEDIHEEGYEARVALKIHN